VAVNRSEVVEELKRYAPASLKVTMRDGTDKPVAVPKAGNRWARCQQVLDSLPWVSIECLDKAGSLLKVVEDDDELDALVGDDETNLGMAKLMLEVMRTTMKETRSMVDVQMRAMSTAMGAVVDAQNTMVETYRNALQTQQQYLQLASAPAESDSKEMMTMLQMAMHLMAQAKAKAPAGGA
jgi:hypothetical protein